MEKLLGFGIIRGFDFVVLAGFDVDFSKFIFLKEEMELIPVVFPSSLVMGVLKSVHGYFSGFISGNNFADEESIAQISAYKDDYLRKSLTE